MDKVSGVSMPDVFAVPVFVCGEFGVRWRHQFARGSSSIDELEVYISAQEAGSLYLVAEPLYATDWRSGGSYLAPGLPLSMLEASPAPSPEDPGKLQDTVPDYLVVGFERGRAPLYGDDRNKTFVQSRPEWRFARKSEAIMAMRQAADRDTGHKHVWIVASVIGLYRAGDGYNVVRVQEGDTLDEE